MPPTFTIIQGGSDREAVYDPGRSRTPSGGSRSNRSAGSGGRSYSGSGGSESWSEVGPPYGEAEEDEIEPSDSASRSRQPSSRRQSQSRPPAPLRRHSSRRVTEPEAETRRRHSSRRHHSSRHRRGDSRRVPSDESSSTVASHDDYPYGHHNVPPRAVYPPPSGYRHVPAQGHGGYPPSMVTSAPGHPDAYNAQSLVHMPQQDPFGYPVHNAFSPPAGSQGNPFSPMSNASATSYFATEPHAPPMQHHHRPQAPPRPQSFIAPSSHYGSEMGMMSPYGHPGMPAYPGYPMHMPGYPHVAGWPPYPPPSQATSPPPQTPQAPPAAAENKELESLKALLQTHEEARVAREKAMIAKAEADAAAYAERKAKEEEEKKKKEEIAAASKKAKEDAEQKAADAAKKAKEEHEKKLNEAQTAKEEAEKKQKELEEETKKLQPAPDAGKAPIRFKDAVGRKFSFPFHLCKTWKGMEGLIKQAFLHVDVIGEHVHQGHYDLTGPDGEIILPQVWDTMIQPDWEVSMHMWPIPEEKEKKKKKEELEDPFASLGLGDLGDLGIIDPGKKKAKTSGSKKKKAIDANIITIPPPPGLPPAGILSDPLAGGIDIFASDLPKKEKSSSSRPKAKSKSSKDSALASWFAGSSGSKSSKKGDEKLDALVRRKSASSSSHSSRADQVSCAVM